MVRGYVGQGVREMSLFQYNQVLRRFESSFRGYFTQITDDDMAQLLDNPRESLLVVLQERYGYSSPEAKAAWNDFVLRVVDGHPAVDEGVVQPPVRSLPHTRQTRRSDSRRRSATRRQNGKRCTSFGLWPRKISLL